MKEKTADDHFESPVSLAWKKFRKDKLAMSGFFAILIAFFVVISGPLIRPDSSPAANAQQLSLAFKKPGFKAQVLRIRKNDTNDKAGIFSQWLHGKKNNYQERPIYSYRFEGRKVHVELYTGFDENNGEQITYDIADVLYPVDQVKQIEKGNDPFLEIHLLDGEVIVKPVEELQEKVKQECIVNRTFLLGTDKYGRDLLSRLMSGTTISFSIGFVAVGISVMLGIMLGALSGYFRGWVDQLIMWLINVVWSIPTLLLVIAITLVLGKGHWQVFVAVGLTMWVEVARVVRGQVLSIREKEYIEAAKVLGYGHLRIITKHIIPNVINPVIVISAANFASAILIEAGLSFLGLGAQPPQATWGRMISEHKGYIITGDAHLAIIPGLAIMVMVLAFMLIGNGLRDALDNRSEL